MVKAIFIDFYGTVVHEDGAVINKITEIIRDTGSVKNKKDISAYWWNCFQNKLNYAYGNNFRTQRELEFN